MNYVIEIKNSEIKKYNNIINEMESIKSSANNLKSALKTANDKVSQVIISGKHYDGEKIKLSIGDCDSIIESCSTIISKCSNNINRLNIEIMQEKERERAIAIAKMKKYRSNLNNQEDEKN